MRGPTMFDTDFDGQRLKFHPLEVADWLSRGRTRGPLYTEMELSSGCNQRCIFCGVDHLIGGTPIQIDTGGALRILSELSSLGNRSVMFSGHGEPLLHDDAGEIIRFASSIMSTSVTTNGVAVDDAGLGLVDDLKWIRFSVNGCDARNYATVHGTGPRVFDRVMTNIAGTVRRKRDQGLRVTIGVQMVLLDQNASGVVDLGRRIKETGVDYFSVKPYSQHPMSRNRQSIDYSLYLDLERPLKELEDDSFRVVFRSGSMSKLKTPKAYGQCLGTHFLNFISASGDVWECNVFAGDPGFLIGNALETGFEEIWTGSQRKEVLGHLQNRNLESCRDVCRMDECNRYLWRLRNPGDHDDFI